MTALRCSEASLDVGESLTGTAVEGVHTWLLLEVNDPWAPKAIESSVLAGVARSRIESWLRDHAGTRLQLVRRPGRASRRPRFMVVDTRARRIADIELEDHASLAEVDLGTTLSDASPMVASMSLVCVHGRRDRCCAEHGSAVFRALSRNGVDVWQTSHLGGHRFAACALWLPDGLMYGRLRKDHVDAFVEAHETKSLGDLDHFRGRCVYDRPTQAAETFLRERIGDHAIDSLVWRSTESESESVWRVRFEVGTEAHAVRVERQALPALRPASCGGEPEVVARFVEVA